MAGYVASPTRHWAVTHVPAVNVVATATKAAGGAGVRHICTSIAVTFATNAAAAAIARTVRLRDGATGAGTILWAATLAVTATAGDGNVLVVPNLQIPGSPNTAMTLEFDGAGGANTFETVAITGWSTEGVA